MSDKIRDDERDPITEDTIATSFSDLEDVPGLNTKSATTELYLRAFDYPTLDDIIAHRGLQGLGNRDSGLMTPMGGHLVHEALHWRYLVINKEGDNADDFNELVIHTVFFEDDDGDVGDPPIEEERDYIDDYTVDDPEWHPNPFVTPFDGYGPRNCRELVSNAQGDSFRNADSHYWYIISKF